MPEATQIAQENDYEHNGPLVDFSDQAEKLPGKWRDEQKLTLETFKEIVTTDTENVWVIAYIDPRCEDCVQLSLEWEKLTRVEEVERRKVKMGYVDLSVAENWRIVQDHTRGKKLTHAPTITIYGENKQSPHWYAQGGDLDLNGMHTWVSSYADTHGYGYWDPDEYTGSGVMPHYASGYHKYRDSPMHNGALNEIGIEAGPNGKGYAKAGKWQVGKSITQLNTDRQGMVMNRRTTTQGGKLYGAAHKTPKQHQNDTLRN